MDKKDRKEVKKMIQEHRHNTLAHIWWFWFLWGFLIVVFVYLSLPYTKLWTPLRDITSARWETKCDDKLVEKTFYEIFCPKQTGEGSIGYGMGSYNETEIIEFLKRNEEICETYDFSSEERAVLEKTNCYQLLVREVDKD